jgi:hypothetical protein
MSSYEEMEVKKSSSARKTVSSFIYFCSKKRGQATFDILESNWMESEAWKR